MCNGVRTPLATAPILREGVVIGIVHYCACEQTKKGYRARMHITFAEDVSGGDPDFWDPLLKQVCNWDWGAHFDVVGNLFYRVSAKSGDGSLFEPQELVNRHKIHFQRGFAKADQKVA